MTEQPAATAQGVVRVSHHMYYLTDEHYFPQMFPHSTNGLIAVEPGAAEIFTGIHTGAVAVMVEVRQTPPAEVTTSGWDEVVEVSMESLTGQVVVAAGMSDRPDLPVLTTAGPGYYRVRVHARGRDIAPDLVVPEPIEDYLIVVWPDPTPPEISYKQTDQYGAGLRRSAAEAPPARPAPEPAPMPKRVEKQERLKEMAIARARAQVRRPTDG